MNHSELLLEAIFTKCGLVYGRDFLGRWEGLNLEEVKADWRRELGRWLQYPQAVKYALEHLPADRAPNVLQFRALCREAPEEPTKPVAEIELSPEQKMASAEIKRRAVAALKIMGSRRPRAEEAA